MTTIRYPAVAGTFYPADPQELRGVVRSLLAAARPTGSAPKAMIVPHAGYIYSGPIAASAYSLLREVRGRIKRIVLLGPAHRVPFHGLAASSASAFATPLGQVPVDMDAFAKILSLPQVRLLDQAHVQEHSLEVHLPFLQETLENFSLVPLVVGEATPQEVADVL